MKGNCPGKASVFFADRAVRTLVRIGDIMAPSGAGFPSFSETGSIQHFDDILRHLPPQDRQDLHTLLVVLSFLPRKGLKVFLYLLDRSSGVPGPLGAILRVVHLGLRGLVWTLYYSNKAGTGYAGWRVYDLIGFWPRRAGEYLYEDARSVARSSERRKYTRKRK